MSRRTLIEAVLALLATGALTTALRGLGVANPTTVALAHLLLVLFVASFGSLTSAVITSIAAMLLVNFFFLPPTGAFALEDPTNWIALGAFLIVSIVASHLSTSARARAQEAQDRRRELARLFDVSRDILLTTETERPMAAVARHVARRFELAAVRICVPAAGGGWDVYDGGAATLTVDERELDRTLAGAKGVLEFDSRARVYSGHRTTADADGRRAVLVPIRFGTRPVGLMALHEGALEAGTAEAIAGVIAVAMERDAVLTERQASETARQRSQLSSALLASISHDLRTPLTAIGVALDNMADPAIGDADRLEQGQLAHAQVDQLSRLVQDILDMARIETGISVERQWVTPAEVVDAAISSRPDLLRRHELAVDAVDDVSVEVDPRLTSMAIAHLLENAAQYSPQGTSIRVSAIGDVRGLHVSVSDQGPGLEPQELERLFEPFFRGHAARARAAGSGMGLSITKGLLAPQGGRVWGENISPHGARFSVSIPAAIRRIAPLQEPA